MVIVLDIPPDRYRPVSLPDTEIKTSVGFGVHKPLDGSIERHTVSVRSENSIARNTMHSQHRLTHSVINIWP